MKIYFVYILLCNDGTYYTGITNNLEYRLAQHQSGSSSGSYTFYRRPVDLVFSEAFYDINLAIEWEKRIKGWSKTKKEALINDNWDNLASLSQCKNSTTHRNYLKSGFDSAQPDTGDGVE